MSCDNRNNCPCTYPCARHGKCCECVAYHRDIGEVPGCFFSAKAEAEYNRSLSRLVKDRKER